MTPLPHPTPPTPLPPQGPRRSPFKPSSKVCTVNKEQNHLSINSALLHCMLSISRSPAPASATQSGCLDLFGLHASGIAVVLLKSPPTAIALLGTRGCPLCDGSMLEKSQKDACFERACTVPPPPCFFCLLTSVTNSRKCKWFWVGSAVALSISETETSSCCHCLARLLVLFATIGSKARALPVLSLLFVESIDRSHSYVRCTRSLPTLRHTSIVYDDYIF